MGHGFSHTCLRNLPTHPLSVSPKPVVPRSGGQSASQRTQHAWAGSGGAGSLTRNQRQFPISWKATGSEAGKGWEIGSRKSPIGPVVTPQPGQVLPNPEHVLTRGPGAKKSCEPGKHTLGSVQAKPPRRLCLYFLGPAKNKGTIWIDQNPSWRETWHSKKGHL